MFSPFKNTVCLLTVALLSASAGIAQTIQPMQLQQAIAMARTHSNKLHTDSLQSLVIQTQVAQVAAHTLPELNVNATLERLSGNIKPFIITLPQGSFAINPQILNQSYNTVQLRQLLFSGGKLSSMLKALRKEVAASKSDYQKSILENDRQTIDLWFNLYNSRTAEKIILANIEALNSTREEQKKVFKQGIILENDLLKIELSITRLRSGLADITALAGTLNYNLCLATGLDPAVQLEIAETFIPGSILVQPLAFYTEAAIAQRPELKSLAYRKQAAGYRTKAAIAEYFPMISLIGSYDYDRPNQRIFPNVPHYNYSALAGVNLSWNISGFYTNQHKVTEARLMARQLMYASAQLQENIMAEVNAGHQEYKKTIDKISLSELELSQAKENYRVESNRLKAQTTTPTDFLIADASLLQAQLNLATAKANAGLAYQKLIIATGTTAN